MSSQITTTKDRAIRLISQIQSAHIRQIRQRRENNRQTVSIPGKIRPCGSPGEIDTLTRDLSSEGMGLITAEPISEQTQAEIEIALPNCSESIFAKCCWCHEYGSFYISGWKFVNEPNGLDL